MPDIISKIRVEATGADQAAREIRKLKEAYDLVAESAKGIMQTGAASVDPFAKAVSKPGKDGAGGGESIEQRESRSRTYRDQVRERETSGGRTGLGGINKVMSATEAAATGRGGGAAAELSSSLGTVIGGALGGGLLAAGLVGMGAQKFADNAFGRMESIYGAGVSQRLGRNYEDIQNIQTGYGRSGVPFGMVQSFFQAGSQTGLNMNRPGALNATSMAMEAMVSMGVDPGTIAGLMGGMSKAGLDLGRVNYGMFGQAAQSVGRENVGVYLQEMARGITSMATQGIDITEESLTKQTNILSALSQFGGLSPEGAAAASQLLQGRAIGASSLQRPEDIIAYSMMRKARPGMDITDIMVEMEKNPEEMTRAIYEYLDAATGGKQKEMRLRMRQYLGQGTTMGMTVGIMEAIEMTRGMEPDEAAKILGVNSPWMDKHLDEEGNWIPNDPARTTYSVRQAEMLRKMEETMLDLTESIGKAIRNLFMGPVRTSALGMHWSGYQTNWREMSVAQARAQGGIVQDVTAAYVELDAQHLSFKDTQAFIQAFTNTGVVTAAASGAAMRADPSLSNYFKGMYESAGISEQFGEFERGEVRSLGNWGIMIGDIMAGFAKRAEEEVYAGVMGEGGTKSEARAAGKEARRVYGALMYELEFRGNRDVALVDALARLVQFLDESRRGIVNTDGESYSPSPTFGPAGGL